jgi:ferritin heavy chain
MELSLALERLNMQKLQQLDKLAHDLDDFNLSDFVDDMLDDQSKDVKRAAEYVAQLQRVGKGHGVWHWDETLYAAGLK